MYPEIGNAPLLWLNFSQLSDEAMNRLGLVYSRALQDLGNDLGDANSQMQ